MGQDPSDIRAEIEETRMRVGEEVDAISYKTDVGARVGDYVDDKKEAITSKMSGAKDRVTGVMPDGRQMGRMKNTAERNPLGLAVGGLALGFVAGLLLPSTRMENEQLGEMSDRVVDAAKETGREALDRGKEVAQEATQAAKETAQETGREQGKELASTLQERTQQGSPSSA